MLWFFFAFSVLLGVLCGVSFVEMAVALLHCAFGALAFVMLWDFPLQVCSLPFYFTAFHLHTWRIPGSAFNLASQLLSSLGTAALSHCCLLSLVESDCH